MSGSRIFRLASIAILSVVFVLGMFAGLISHSSYATQFRELPNSPPSAAHLLGTDSLGRDLFTRLIYGSRVSLLLAPAAAIISTLIASVLGSLAGLAGGWTERVILALADLYLSLPLLFVLLALRALLPIDISPALSVLATFALLGALGWPASLRVVWATARALRDSDLLLLARATGSRRWRILLLHVLPNLRPVMLAQFCVSIPMFILAEATLSMLGLGVMEPMPSWGNLLRGLEDFSTIAANPWRLAPFALLVTVVICFQLSLPAQEEIA